MTTKTRLFLLLTSMATVLVLQETASPITPFKSAFDQKYVKPSNNADYKKKFRKIGCNACHVKGKQRDWLNAYGHELAKLIRGNAEQRLDEAKKQGKEELKAEEAKINQELEVAFDQVAKLKSPSGVLYAELFKAHEFPSPDGAKSLQEVDETAPEKEE